MPSTDLDLRPRPGPSPLVAPLILVAGALGPSSAVAQVVNLAADAVRSPAVAERGSTVRVELGLEALGGPSRTAYAVLLTQGGLRTGAVELARFGPVDLPADLLVSFSVDVALPAGLTGIRRIAIEVDPADAVTESNESDNLAFARRELTILPPRVDLQVRDVVLSAERRRPGESLEVAFSLANLGRVAAGPMPLAVGIGRDGVATASDRVLLRSSVDIAAGVTRTERLTVSLPADLAAGAWRIGVVLDPEGALAPLDPAGRAAVAATPLVIERPELTLLTRSFPDAVLGRIYSLRLMANGGDGQYTFTLTGPLPDGLTYDPATQLVSGTPTRAGRFPVEVEAASAGITDSAELELVVQPSGRDLSVVTATLAIGYVSQPYLQRLVADGGEPPYTWSLAQGTLPPGIELDPEGHLTGRPSELGTTELTLEVEDRLGARRSAPEVLVVSLAPEVLIETERVDARVGEPIDVAFTAIGGVRPLTWRAETTEPPGLELTEDGRLVGTPTAVGRFPFQASATDDTRPGVRDVAFVEVEVADTGILAITSGPMDQVPRFALFEHELTAEGGTPPYAWTLVPGDFLPAGFALVPGPERDYPADTGVIYGRVFDGALSAFTVRVEDAYGRRARQPLVFFADTAQLGTPDGSGGGCRDGGRAPAGPPLTWILFGLAAVAGAAGGSRRLRRERARSAARVRPPRSG